MTAGLGADILEAVRPAVGIDIPGLNEVLAATGHIAGTNGTAADIDRAKQAAQNLDAARRDLLAIIRANQLELQIAEHEDLVLDGAGWGIDQDSEKNGKTMGMAISGMAGLARGIVLGLVTARSTVRAPVVRSMTCGETADIQC